jgi:hypothetical protein
MPEILKAQFIVCLFDALNYDVKHGTDFYSGEKWDLFQSLDYLTRPLGLNQ